MEFRADLHIHSYKSFDCNSSPGDIVKYALKRNLNVIAITDHDTIEGGLIVQEFASRETRLTVVVGAEIMTRKGDIAGLFLKEDIRSESALDVIAEIREQGGVSVLVHPFRSREPDEKVVNAVDAIEIYNLDCGEIANLLAQSLALRSGKPGITGSDAHEAKNIGSVYTAFTKRNNIDGVFGKNFLEFEMTPLMNISANA